MYPLASYLLLFHFLIPMGERSLKKNELTGRNKMVQQIVPSVFLKHKNIFNVIVHSVV